MTPTVLETSSSFRLLNYESSRTTPEDSMLVSRHGIAYVVRLASFVASKDLVLARTCDIRVSLHTLATTVTCLRRVTATSKSASAMLLNERPRLRGLAYAANLRPWIRAVPCIHTNVSNDISPSHPSYNVTFCSTTSRLQSNSFHGIGAFELATTRHTTLCLSV